MLLTIINTEKAPAPIEWLQTNSFKRAAKKTGKEYQISLVRLMGNGTEANDRPLEDEGAFIFHSGAVYFIGIY